MMGKFKANAKVLYCLCEFYGVLTIDVTKCLEKCSQTILFLQTFVSWTLDTRTITTGMYATNMLTVTCINHVLKGQRLLLNDKFEK